MRYPIHIQILLLLQLSGCVSTNQSVNKDFLTTISLESVDTKTEYISNYFKDKNVVQIGESIHMTNELVEARLPVLKAIRSSGFDIILFEGSTIDAWLAADYLLEKPHADTNSFATAGKIAFPPIWRFAAYDNILQFVSSTWNTESPIYLASYDLQPGMGYFKEDSIKELIKVLRKYKSPTAGTVEHLYYLNRFSDRINGFPKMPPDIVKLDLAISELDLWIQAVAPIIKKKYPTLPHDKIALAIPKQLKRQLLLWNEHQNDPEKQKMKVYQETRERLAAEAIQDFMINISNQHKIVVWAHNVHVFHNSLGKARHSLGSELKSRLDNKLYTIGTFAGEGSCLSLNGEDVQQTEFKNVNAETFDYELSALNANDFYMDFNSASNFQKILDISNKTRIEGRSYLEIVPRQDFDAAIFVHKVTPPKVRWK